MDTLVENESGFKPSRDKPIRVAVDLEVNDDTERGFERVKSFTDEVLNPIESITGPIQQKAQMTNVTVLFRDLIVPIVG